MVYKVRISENMAPSLLLPIDGNVIVKPDLPTTTDSNSQTKSLGEANGSATSAVLHRDLHHAPLRVIAAKGNYLTLENGRQILYVVSNIISPLTQASFYVPNYVQGARQH